MKLLAVTNGKSVVFSVGHYDCRGAEGLMADGGQPGCTDYAGYTRFSHKPVWIELPGVNFATLYADYQTISNVRAYGYHNIDEVRLLSDAEVPDVHSIERKIEGAVWGTYGKDGKGPLRWIMLKDAETDHLEAILKTQRVTGTIGAVITELLKRRKES